MLNISTNSVRNNIDPRDYEALKKVEERNSGRVILRLMTGILILFIIIAFLPWTQNINARGNVTTLKPDQRPQTIHSIIAGRVEQWFVKEGDFVNKGDTILYISEVKDEYFDPDLLVRTKEQLDAKELAVNSYEGKSEALTRQIEALKKTRELKTEQAQNKLKQAYLKVTSDSIDYQAALIAFKIAEEQFKRFEDLHANGLKSLTELENRKLKFQKVQAEMISNENDLLTSQNEVINAKVELNSIQAQYADKITKAESEKYTALSSMYDSQATATKLKNQYSNYTIRNGLYYIRAPQDGYITKAIQSGLGETIKQGEEIVSIMPSSYELAVEMYVKPIDLPLLEKGQPIRIQFDGWPAIVFSGWPNTSYGTYGGLVFAIDNFISDNGKYRVLVSVDPNDHQWPDALRIGAGANNMVLLKDVPIWYELWRRINGFPPDYYKTEGK